MNKLDKAQEKRLNFQKRCRHFEIDQTDDGFKCVNCNKSFGKDDKWHGHEVKTLT